MLRDGAGTGRPGDLPSPSLAREQVRDPLAARPTTPQTRAHLQLLLTALDGAQADDHSGVPDTSYPLRSEADPVGMGDELKRRERAETFRDRLFELRGERLGWGAKTRPNVCCPRGGPLDGVDMFERWMRS